MVLRGLRDSFGQCSVNLARQGYSGCWGSSGLTSSLWFAPLTLPYSPARTSLKALPLNFPCFSLIPEEKNP